MDLPEDGPGRPPTFGRADHFRESIDTVVMRAVRELSEAGVPEAAPQRGVHAQNGIQGLSAHNGETNESNRAALPSFAGSSLRPPASSQATAVISPNLAKPGTTPSEDESLFSALIDTPPSPGGVWATNAAAFASGSHPGIQFVSDMPTSEPRLSREKGKGVEKRYHTEPVAGGKDCSCAECNAQKKGLLSSEMIYAYLAMRGAQNGEGLFEGLMAKYRENGRAQIFPGCPHALSKMSKELEDAASKRAGKHPIVNAPSIIRTDAGPSHARTSVADFVVADPSNAGSSSVVPALGIDFNEDNVSDGGDVAKGTISPSDFLRMASGISSAETEKPLPPLPSNGGATAHQKSDNEDESQWEDRVDGTTFRNQICEETREALTGSYTVSSNPSMINEPPGVRHLSRLRGAFGSLFTRMQPRLGERLDRVRLGLPNESGSSLSIFSESEYTAADLEAALASPSATAINGIPPPRVQATLAEAERTTTHLEDLEATAHRRAVDSSERLNRLRTTVGRVAAAATYITDHRSSTRRAKIRRSVGHRLRGLEYRRARALDGLRDEEARHARDIEAIREAEAAVERIVETVNMRSAEEVLGEASRLWDEAHGREGRE